MKLFICVSDYWQQRQYYLLYPSEINNNKQTTSYHIERLSRLKCGKTNDDQRKSAENTGPSSTLRRISLSIDGIQFYYLLKELLHFKEYRRVLCTHPIYSSVQLLWLQIVPPTKDIIDWKWNDMVTRKLWEKIETDYLMSWLSTLGGGYSALGEQFSNCAEVAGKISKKQLRIGIQLGDPFLQSRCLLYYSISLIQVGELRKAKYIIKKQYSFARANEEVDGRLVKMCEGIWMRLQYEYGLRRLKKKTGKTSTTR